MFLWFSRGLSIKIKLSALLCLLGLFCLSARLSCEGDPPLALTAPGETQAQADPGTPGQDDPEATPSALVLPPQGLYESCLPEEVDCLERLEKMGQAGFTLVLNDGLRYAATAASIRAYADAADRLHMQVILPVKYSPEWDEEPAYLVAKFPELAAEGGCTDNASFLRYYTGILKDHPALWGYYMADEQHAEYHDGLKVYADLVRELDPAHPRLIVEEGSNDPMEIFFTFPAIMQDTADVLGVDYYPYGYIESFTRITRYTGASARTTREWAQKLGLGHALVLQAYAMPMYYDMLHALCLPWPFCAPFPNYRQMKAQRDQVLLNATPELILWFSYPDILRSDDPEQHWEDLVAAAFADLPQPAPAPTAQPAICPPGWACEDIGSPALAGSQSLEGNRWVVQGSGWDIWSTEYEKADQFHYVWHGLAGDGELSARVNPQADANGPAKAGLMLRKTFDPIAPYYALLVTPDQQVRVQIRRDFGQDPVTLSSAAQSLPIFLKIERHATTFSAYTSANGLDWTLLKNSTVDLPGLQGPAMAGLAVSSNSETSIHTAGFENVTLSGIDE